MVGMDVFPSGAKVKCLVLMQSVCVFIPTGIIEFK